MPFLVPRGFDFTSYEKCARQSGRDTHSGLLPQLRVTLGPVLISPVLDQVVVVPALIQTQSLAGEARLLDGDVPEPGLEPAAAPAAGEVTLASHTWNRAVSEWSVSGQ